VCGEPALASSEGIAFDAVRGGVLCPAHERGASRLPADVLRAAGDLAAGADPGPLESAPVEARRALRDLTQTALRAHLRRPLHSLAFFAAMPRSDKSPHGDTSPPNATVGPWGPGDASGEDAQSTGPGSDD